MASDLKRSGVSSTPWLVGSGLLALSMFFLFSDRLRILIVKKFSKNLINELEGEATDDFLDLLLIGMDLSFYFSKSYGRNIENFDRCYLFETQKGGVRSGVKFKNGSMTVFLDGVPDSDWDAKVTFEDPKSLRKYLLSKDQDLLDSLLKNSIQVDGNHNLIFKFCFMVKDLKRRFGLPL